MGKRFEDLEVYKAAEAFDSAMSSIFTFDRFKTDLGLRTQLMNSSGSCEDNIAEGYERGGNKELANFLRIAKGSIGESRAQLRRARRRQLISNKEYEQLSNMAEGISRQLSGYLKYLKNSDFRGERYMKEPEIVYGKNSLES